MMQKPKRRTLGVMLLTLIVSLSCCAGLTVRTWFLDGKNYEALIRKNPDGSLKEKLSFVEADGYRCYSPVDDEAIRNRLIECCSK